MSGRRGLGPVAIFGAGKAGRGLKARLGEAGVRARLDPSRGGLPARPWRGVWLLVIATREGEVGPAARRIAEAGWLDAGAAVVHVAGALTAEALAPLRGRSAGVGQMHPMMSFAEPRRPPRLEGGHVRVAGDAEAVRRASRLARALGMRPRRLPGLDEVAYHAAAGLVANGAAALAAAGADLLGRAGVDPAVAPLLLGPLLRSVADNVEALGLPGALTGPVRRGDAGAVGRHLETLGRLAPHLAPLYRAMARAQLPLARALGDADAAAFDALEARLGP
ncbi:MAG TPA: DUF2520 domain-containing protein [Polyangiaceae bacterium]|nr:DUF2520 domain-containing protein [Polyangiaceae bacterium]